MIILSVLWEIKVFFAGSAQQNGHSRSGLLEKVREPKDFQNLNVFESCFF